MTEKQNTGGPAFPAPINEVFHTGGMTLRDYFAAKAMQGMLIYRTKDRTAAAYADEAYAMADAMLKARDGQP